MGIARWEPVGSTKGRSLILDGSYAPEAAALNVLRLVFQAFGIPRSLVHVGGGTGTWARVSRDLGVDDVLVMDSKRVPLALREVPPASFISVDLSESLPTIPRTDMLLCLNVVQDLTLDKAQQFIASMCEVSPTIVFSVPLPGQSPLPPASPWWLSEWVREFADLGFRFHDPVRPNVWDDPNVSWALSQTIVVFRRGDAPPAQSALPIDVVHPGAWEYFRNASFEEALARDFHQPNFNAVNASGMRLRWQQGFWSIARSSYPYYQRLPLPIKRRLRALAHYVA